MSSSGSPIQVLHVDNEPDFVERTAAVLERENDRITVQTATTRDAAESIAEQTDIDCIVAGDELPTVDGVECIDAIREIQPALPAILFTNNKREAVASEAIAAGDTDYLRKGSSSETFALLANRIKNAVAASRRNQHDDTQASEIETILQTVPAAVTRVNPDGEIVYANDRAETHLGIEPSEVTDRTYNDPEWEITDTDGEPLPEDELPFAQIMRSGEPVSGIRHNILTKDSSYLTVEINGTPVFDDAGEIESVVFAIRDVTDKQERVQELERYKILHDHSPTHTVLLGADGRVNYHNLPPNYKIAADDWVGESFDSGLHPDDKRRIKAEFEQVLESDPGETVTSEFRYEVGEGNYRWFETRTTNYLETDAIEGILAAGHDVTQRKETEQHLAAYASDATKLQAASHELLEATDQEEVAEITIDALESVFDFALAGIWLCDDSSDELRPATQSEEAEELIGEMPVYQSDSDSLSWEAFEMQAPRLVPDVMACENRYADETPIKSEMVIPLGEYGILNIGATEREAFTEQDLHRAETWGQMVTAMLARLETIDDLREKGKELQRQRDRLNEFASFIAHDLRNPLNVAQGRLKLALAECDCPHLAPIERSINRMEALIEDVLSLAREGTTIGEVESVELASLVSDCWENIDAEAATIRAETTATIEADSSRVASILENLFRNAIEHGGSEVAITVGSLPDGFYVADDGAGIPPEERDSIFDMGYSESEDGTGIGLAIVQQIVEAHGWEISVTESAAGGARFEIRGVTVESG